MCPKSLLQGISKAKSLGLSPKVIIPVDLFGLPSDYEALENIARDHDLWILDDAAQGFGGVYKGWKIGTFGEATTTSFFPAKPLGCYGDGGAVFTDNLELYEVLKSLRVHGQGSDKYDNIRIGMNGRLDTLQAAILIEKLSIFDEEIQLRNKVAAYYHEGLKDIVQTPFVPEGLTSTWAQYTLTLPHGIERARVLSSLKEDHVPTGIYYPTPLHKQTAYKHYPAASEILAVAEDLGPRVFSLPMHPYLSEADQDYIITAVHEAMLRV